jgi:hypothetical protein
VGMDEKPAHDEDGLSAWQQNADLLMIDGG